MELFIFQNWTIHTNDTFFMTTAAGQASTNFVEMPRRSECIQQKMLSNTRRGLKRSLAAMAVSLMLENDKSTILSTAFAPTASPLRKIGKIQEAILHNRPARASHLSVSSLFSSTNNDFPPSSAASSSTSDDRRNESLEQVNIASSSCSSS